MIKLKLQTSFILTILAFILKISDAQNQCSTFTNLWQSRIYSYDEEYSKLSLPKNFDNVCTTSKCCNPAMQNKMVGISMIKLKSMAEIHLKSIISFLFNSSDNLNEYFQNNLDISRNEMHEMFLNTYTTNYKQNQPFFFDFYDKLKQYMEGKEQDIEKILDTFFHEMAQKMLTLMVIPRPDSETIRCMTSNFLKMDPYQTIDKAIINNFKTAYPVARMLVNSLRAAQDVFEELVVKKSTPTVECAEIHAKAFHCSLCSAIDIMPCEGVCKSIVGKCFGSFNSKEMARLNKSWKTLLKALEQMSKKLKHPFNFVEMNKNLHVKISDAIMNVHNFFPTVKNKILENCKPTLVRKRRSPDGTYNHFQNFRKPQSILTQKAMELSPLVDKLSSQIPEMLQHLQKHKNIICSGKLKLPKPGKECWDGQKTTLSFKMDPKDKKQNKNLVIDPLIQSSISKLNSISVTINNLLSDKTKDPVSFKIKFVKKLRRIETPSQTRSLRISEQPIEGSGDDIGDRSILNPGINRETTVVVTEKPPEIIEGSGSKIPPNNNRNIKGQPTFPELPTLRKNPTLPKEPIKKPVIPDDEDLASNENENEKAKKPKPFNRKKAPIEGSGSVEGFETSTERIKIFTTTTITTKPVTHPRKPINGKEPSLPEGSGQTPDDETSYKNEENPRVSIVPVPSSTTPQNEVTTAAMLLPNELPGEIPNEIWIPRVVDYDSYGKIARNIDDKSSSEKIYAAISLKFTVFVVMYIYKLI